MCLLSTVTSRIRKSDQREGPASSGELGVGSRQGDEGVRAGSTPRRTEGSQAEGTTPAVRYRRLGR